MINEQFNLLRDFAEWVRVHTGKSANIEVSIWCHSKSSEESTEYSVWVEGLIRKRSKNLDELVEMIPKFKQFCELNMEVSA